MSLILNESLVLAKTRSQDLKSVLKLNCWGSGIKDVSLVRQMVNVEVIGLSCNEITTLEDFAHCPKLKELILRKNKIENIAEIAHLQGLPKLTTLWLGDNPCADNTHNYRKVVLKALPNLTILDNQPVTREELQEIEQLGNEIYEEIPYDSVNSSSSGHSFSAAATARSMNLHQNNTQQHENLQESHQDLNNGNEQYQSSNIINNNNTIDSSHYQQMNETITSTSHEVSAMSIQGATSNQLNDSHYSTTNSVSHNNSAKTPLRPSKSGQGSQYTSGWSSTGSGNNNNNHNNNNNNVLPKGGKNRNANILSAVLCLVKELDYISCEVVQTALHCRMEETLP